MYLAKIIIYFDNFKMGWGVGCRGAQWSLHVTMQFSWNRLKNCYSVSQWDRAAEKWSLQTWENKFIENNLQTTLCKWRIMIFVPFLPGSPSSTLFYSVSLLFLFGGMRQRASVLHILSKTEAYVFAFQLLFIIKYFQSLRGY